MLGIVVIPLVLVGPGLLSRFLSQRFDGLGSLSWLGLFYWPVVTVFSLIGLTTLYHVAIPVPHGVAARRARRRARPGIWVLASFGLRFVIAASVGGTSIYGPLATPIVVLIWLYFLAIAVLIGAALNAALDEMFPQPARVRARTARAVARPITPLPPLQD